MFPANSAPSAQESTNFPPLTWEPVIGLEVHTELLTNTKLFSSSPNEFGADPNTHIDPVCLGLPGTLPVVNKRAVELAIKAGLALNCEVQPSTFARKNYFYPDMPKNYQISQYENPINIDGFLELPSGKRVGIVRAHLEEDTGKSTHMGGGGRIHDAGYSLIDYNRAGVPLLEIVSAPELGSSDEAREYVAELRDILVAVGASDGKMEEGSLRVDANISVRRSGGELGTRCEVKNVNSLRSLGRAIDFEIQRQVKLLESGGSVKQETRHWNEEDGKTHPLRSKEGETDYRYFLEPDLPPVAPAEEWIAEIKDSLPLLPAERRQRLREACQNSGDRASSGRASGGGQASGGGASDDQASKRQASDANIGNIAVVVTRDQDRLALDTLAMGTEAELVLKHIVNNLASGSGNLKATDFAELLKLEATGELSASQSKTLLGDLVDGAESVESAIQQRGFESADTGELEALVKELITQHPDEWKRYCEGEQKLQGFFVGKVMKATSGSYDGQTVAKLLAQLNK